MQWIRRCKQEEIALIDSLVDEDEVQERLKLMKQFGKSNNVPSVAGSKRSVKEESKTPS